MKGELSRGARAAIPVSLGVTAYALVFGVLQIVWAGWMVTGGFPAVVRSLHQATGMLIWTAAFVMAEFLGTSYSTIMMAAVIPAVLYYLACWTMIHLEARKEGLQGLPADQLPDIKKVIREFGHLSLPVFAIVGLLLYGLTPLYAAFFTILITIVVSHLRKATGITLAGITRALIAGAKGAVGVAMACAVVGFVVGVSSLTSLGLTFGNNILAMSQNNMLLTLFLTMITMLILGMGLPTTACYIVGATIAAPPLVKLGVEPLVAHFFVFYFACLSNLTPPVCLAAFTAAGIAGAPPYKVGWTSTRLGIAGFLVPFLAVYSPMLMLAGKFTTLSLVEAIITAVVGVIMLSAALEDYLLRRCKLWERVILLVCSLMLMVPGLVTDIVGGVGVALVYFSQKRSLKNE